MPVPQQFKNLITIIIRYCQVEKKIQKADSGLDGPKADLRRIRVI
jgi:hypothetical protein